MLNSSDPSAPAESSPRLMAMTVAALAMATLAETRGSEVGKHSMRVQLFVQALAQQLQTQPMFTALITDAYIEQLSLAAALHDMGTIGIPDRILLKPSKLTPAELAVMKTHPTLAVEAIERIENVLGQPVAELLTLKEMALSHHERWDGSGYPQGLAGEQIPLSARLLAIADVYDALISDRVYKAGIPHSQAVGIIFQGRASQFDPEMVDALIEIEHLFLAIAQQYPNTEQDMQKKIDYMIHAIADSPDL
jgi:putative two-component system response regulator